MTSLPAGDLDHAESLELLKRQTEVCELLASGAPLAEVLDAVTSALEELMAGSRCSVLLLDAERGTLHHGAAPSLPRSYCEAIDGVVIGPDAGSCGAAAFLRAPVIATDIEVDGRWAAFRDLARAHGLRACWSTPIVGDQETVLGTFAVYHDEPHAPTPRENRLVDRFTHLAAVAIDHARLFGALAESEERFRRAFEDNAVGMALISLDGRFLRVNRALCEMVGRAETELLASDFQALTHPDDVPASVSALGRLTAGRADGLQLEQRCLRRDGTAIEKSGE